MLLSIISSVRILFAMSDNNRFRKFASSTISETLDYEAEMATKRLVTLLEPVMIVIMGLVVGGVVAAVIVPIYQSYGTIGASSGAI